MADTCAGYDTTAPGDILGTIKAHMEKDKRDKGKNSRWHGRTHLDQDGSCLIWDLCECDDPAAVRCQENACSMARNGSKVHRPDQTPPTHPIP